MPKMSDATTWTVQIIPAATGICGWIDSLGGPGSITTLNIFALIQCRNSGTTVPDYDFIPNTLQIFGCIQYRNGNIARECQYRM